MDKKSTHHKTIEPKETLSESRRSNWQIVKSVIAGLFGIQSQKNREADFKEGSASDYIIFGIIGVFMLIGLMILIVQQVV